MNQHDNLRVRVRLHETRARIIRTLQRVRQRLDYSGEDKLLLEIVNLQEEALKEIERAIQILL